MLINLAIGLPTILLCLVLQAAFTFWSVRYYMQPIDREAGFAAASSSRFARCWS